MRKGDIITMWEETARLGLEPGAANAGIPHAISVDREGAVTMIALAFTGPHTPELILQQVKKIIDAGSTEFVFALDRYAREGQGCIYRDLLTVDYYDGRGWRFGIAEYSTADGAVNMLPINWKNQYWIDHQRKELARFFNGAPVHRNNAEPIVLPPIAKRPEIDPALLAELKPEQASGNKLYGPLLRYWALLYPGWTIDPAEAMLAQAWLKKEAIKAGADHKDLLAMITALPMLASDPWRYAHQALTLLPQLKSAKRKPIEVCEEESLLLRQYRANMYGNQDAAELAKFLKQESVIFLQNAAAASTKEG